MDNDATKDQIASIMLRFGTADQRKEAEAYLRGEVREVVFPHNETEALLVYESLLAKAEAKIAELTDALSIASRRFYVAGFRVYAEDCHRHTELKTLDPTLNKIMSEAKPNTDWSKDITGMTFTGEITFTRTPNTETKSDWMQAVANGLGWDGGLPQRSQSFANTLYEDGHTVEQALRIMRSA